MKRDTNCNTNIDDRDNMSSLHLARKLGLKRIATKLLDHSAYIHHCNRRNRSSLHLACRGGYPELAQLLIQRGAEIDARDSISNATPFLIAREEDHIVVEVLLKNKANTSIPDMNGELPKEIV